MKSFRLKIDLLPKGAWNNDFSRTLSTHDWDLLRNECYKRAKHKCQICGFITDDLNAHEVWDFNLQKRTQTLKDIIGICNKCHGVIHFRNSERMGYGENAKRHFIKINQCSDLDFAKHLTQALIDYEERNKVYRWKMVADLAKFGGNEITIKSHYIPIIINPYSVIEVEDLSNDYSYKPRILNIEVDNYQGLIKIKADRANKIEWYVDDRIFSKNFNFARDFNTEFSVRDIEGGKVYFILYNEFGIYKSKIFNLKNWN